LDQLAAPLAAQFEAPLGDWRPLLQAWRRTHDGQRVSAAIEARLEAGAVIYPPRLFRAFELTPLARTRVVIVGQDPYHGPGQAEGLAFSVPAGVKPPPSLRNLFAEVERDLGYAPPASGSLVPWAERGVLLLNTSFTVELARAASHASLGWASLADAVLAAAAAEPRPKVFMLWGAHARARAPLIEPAARHLVLQCNHPSPLSARRPPAPFIGCGHFARASAWLLGKGQGDLDWRL
jgi:uracil-DNA glycosylase